LLLARVVSDISGLPSEGFIGAQAVPAAQAKVFAENWLSAPPPSADVLENAKHQRLHQKRDVQQAQVAASSRIWCILVQDGVT
jgi:hypothetical protein